MDVWETNVVNSPSIQTWIPPTNCGDPVIEGIFVQNIAGEKGHFKGSSPALFPIGLQQQIVNQGFLLATLMQQLGYVGRCSFDLILVGESLKDCRVEFIECNARWGGTSAPMTLMNRLPMNVNQTYCIRQIDFSDLWRIEFAALQRTLGKQLYKPSTGQGNFLLFNPARIREQSSLEVITLGGSQASIEAKLDKLSQTVSAIVARHIEPNSITGFLLNHADFDEMETA